MFSLLLPVILEAMPTAYELDFRMLAPNPRGTYAYTIVLSFQREPDVKVPTEIARKYGPDGATSLLMEALDDPRWTLKRNGERITIYGYDDVRILKVAVEGQGPKPLVRRVLAIPPEKRKKE